MSTNEATADIHPELRAKLTDAQYEEWCAYAENNICYQGEMDFHDMDNAISAFIAGWLARPNPVLLTEPKPEPEPEYTDVVPVMSYSMKWGIVAYGEGCCIEEADGYDWFMGYVFEDSDGDDILRDSCTAWRVGDGCLYAEKPTDCDSELARCKAVRVRNSK